MNARWNAIKKSKILESLFGLFGLSLNENPLHLERGSKPEPPAHAPEYLMAGVVDPPLGGAWAVGLCTVGGDVATDAMLSPHLIYLLRSKTLSLRSGGSSLTKLGQVGCVLVYGGTLSVPTVVDVVAKQRATRSD